MSFFDDSSNDSNLIADTMSFDDNSDNKAITASINNQPLLRISSSKGRVGSTWSGWDDERTNWSKGPMLPPPCEGRAEWRRRSY